MKSKVIVLIVVFIVLVAVAKVIVLGQAFMRVTGLTPVTVVKLLFNGGTQLRELEGRTNILLLGIGGGTHEGSDLTDKIGRAHV